MTEIRGLTPLQIDPSKKSKAAEKQTGGADFAAELEKTVAQLENMGSEIDALMKGGQADSTKVTKGVEEVGNMIQSVQGLVDKISPEKTPKAGAKFAASQYEKMAPKKGT